MVCHGDEIRTTSNVRAMDFGHVSKYCSCLPGYLGALIRLTNGSNNELHVWVSPARIVYQVAHAVDQPIVITIEPTQVIKTQVN